MPNSPRTQLPYPSENADPFFEAFVAMVNSIDASLYAVRENRDITIMNGGTLTFNSSTGVLTWSTAIELFSSIAGYVWVIPAGSATLNDGDLIYVTLVRAPPANTNLTAVIGQRVPNLVSGDDQLLFAIRRGPRVYFRNGKVINNGDSLTLFQSTGGGGGGGGFTPGGDLGGDSTTQVVQGIQTIPVANTAPSAANQVLVYNGTLYTPSFITQDMIHPGFNVTPVTRTSANYTIISTDNTIALFNLTGNITVTLPSPPVLGQTFTVVDEDGSLGTWTATVDGNSHDVNGTPIYVMGGSILLARQSITVKWTGGQWSLV